MERERGERKEGAREGLEGAAGETARSTYGSNSVIEANLCAREERSPSQCLLLSK